MLSFSVRIPTDVRFAPGSRAQLRDVLSASNWKRVGFLIDHNLVGHPAICELVAGIEGWAERIVRGSCQVSEPTYRSLEEMRRQFDGPLDVMIGIGGGSALDSAKAMAALVHNRKPAIEYRGFDKLTEPVLPIVAIPTTAGTGSEVTPNASFVDSEALRKLGINGEAVRPRVALLDPELTLSCPERPTVSAAADSLVHGIEAFVAKKSTPFVRLLARDGVARVIEHLPRVVANPADLSARSEVMFGAFLSGVALMHSGTGPAAAMSYPYGVHHKVPHGFAGATFLPIVVAQNVAQGVEDYADLFDGVPAGNAGSRAARAQEFAGKLKRLFADINATCAPSSVGLGDAESTDRFVRDTLELKGALDQNPVPFGEPEIRAAIAAAEGE